jgi:molybdenum cofactor cytidylyltransferase
MIRVAAIVLAAGSGTRIGIPKWRLPLGDGTFLSRIVGRLEHCPVERIIVVVAPSQEAEIRGLLPRANLVTNSQPERGVLSSIREGVLHCGDAEGVLLLPVDHPHVRVETIVTLIEAFRQNPQAVVKPVYSETSGHPVVLPRSIAQSIPDFDVEGGLREFIRRSPVEVIRIAVDDPGILRNINETADL